jgi:hypothetical protein
MELLVYCNGRFFGFEEWPPWPPWSRSVNSKVNVQYISTCFPLSCFLSLSSLGEPDKGYVLMHEHRGSTLVAEPVPTSAKKRGLLLTYFCIRYPTVNYFFTNGYQINPRWAKIQLDMENLGYFKLRLFWVWWVPSLGVLKPPSDQ